MISTFKYKFKWNVEEPSSKLITFKFDRKEYCERKVKRILEKI